jgi:hypothetical protein
VKHGIHFELCYADCYGDVYGKDDGNGNEVGGVVTGSGGGRGGGSGGGSKKAATAAVATAHFGASARALLKSCGGASQDGRNATNVILSSVSAITPGSVSIVTCAAMLSNTHSLFFSFISSFLLPGCAQSV